MKNLLKFRFSLRALLVLLACIAVFLASFVVRIVQPWQAERRAIASISDSVPDAQVFTEPRGQFAFRHFFGDSYSERVVYVHLSDQHVTDEWINEHLSKLQHIEVLTINSPNVTNSGMEQIEAIPSIKSLHLVNTRVSGSAVKKFRTARPSVVLTTGIKMADGTFQRTN